MVRIKAESEADVSDGEVYDGDGASRSIGLNHRKPSDNGSMGSIPMNHKKPSDLGGKPQPMNARYDKKNEEWPSHSIELPDDPQNANPRHNPQSDIMLPKIAAGRASVTSQFSDELL